MSKEEFEALVSVLNRAPLTPAELIGIRDIVKKLESLVENVTRDDQKARNNHVETPSNP